MGLTEVGSASVCRDECCDAEDSWLESWPGLTTSSLSPSWQLHNSELKGTDQTERGEASTDCEVVMIIRQGQGYYSAEARGWNHWSGQTIISSTVQR